MTKTTRNLLELLGQHEKLENQTENCINLGAEEASREKTVELEKSRISLQLAITGRKVSQSPR